MFDTLELLAKRRRELDAAEAAWLVEVAAFDRSGDWRIDGHWSAASALRHACHLNQGVARGLVELARKLDELPEVTAAFARGDISRAHAAVIATARTPKRALEISNCETAFVEVACEQTPKDLGAVVRYVCDAIDGDGGAATEEELYARRRHHASRTLDNMLAVDGLYDPESAEIHEQAINAELARDLRANDPRTLSQRKADALTNLLRESLDRGAIGTAHEVRPHITQIVDLAQHPGATPDLIEMIRNERHTNNRLSRATLERIMCDCDLTRILMNGPSEVLDIGRASRTIPPGIWKALVARDRHCTAPGCTMTPERCEGHHIYYWEDGGPTRLANLRLLCHHHHRQHHLEARARDG